VDAAVQFHNQPPLGTAEINNVLTYGVLAAKLEALESESPQQAPSDLFRFGFLAAKLACPGNLRFATGGGASQPIALPYFWFHDFDPLTPPAPLPQGGEGRMCKLERKAEPFRIRQLTDGGAAGCTQVSNPLRLLAQGEKLPFLQVARHGGVACGARVVCYQDDGFVKVSVQSGEYIENLFGRVRV